ncbi:hypothetical protein QQZ08_000683 [Neonectria magnoliae]|uniref:Major facilitator superfamily (MFS) profile domain-containing protein n=1 Tax=Neonectria magnoliae TaxID=2732573 RepID=A0ABR1II03_9HYPO
MARDNDKDNMSEHREERISDAEAQKHSMAVVPGLEDYVPGTDEEKALVRKIDLFLLPTIWLMYLLSYMDRTNIGNAKIAGMSEDLNLDSDKYSIVLVVFFIGYVLCEVPSK